MSKGSRKREAAAVRRAEEEKLQKEQTRRRRRSRWIIASVAVLAVVGVTVGVLVGNHYKKLNDPDYQVHNTVAASSKNYQVTQAMMTYFISSTSLNFAAQNEAYLETLGLDMESPLSSQVCYFDTSMSWLEYFAASAKEAARWMLSFSEEARATGLTLNEEQQNELETTLDNITPSNYGAYLTKEDIRACLELYFLATAQEEVVQSKMTATDEEINTYYAANERLFQQADCAAYTLSFGEDGAYADKATAQALADTLAALSTEEFEQKVKAELVAQKEYTDETVDEGFATDCLVEGYTYTEGDAVSDWVFAAGRAVGDTFVQTDETSITVYSLRTTPVRNTERAVDVRHILISADTQGSDEKAKEKADELLAQWKDGDATEDAFAELAMENTEDSNASAGGLYTGVLQGQMVETFDEWCFDTARVPGDTGVVKTDYGYHVMYFVDSNEAWYTAAQEELLNERYDTLFKGYIDTYAVTVDDSVVSAIEI